MHNKKIIHAKFTHLIAIILNNVKLNYNIIFFWCCKINPKFIVAAILQYCFQTFGFQL